MTADHPLTPEAFFNVWAAAPETASDASIIKAFQMVIDGDYGPPAHTGGWDEWLAGEVATCHCGQPVAYGFDGNPTHHRGMCTYCDSVRCDVDPFNCDIPKKATWNNGDVAMVECSDGNWRHATYRDFPGRPRGAEWIFADGLIRRAEDSKARPMLTTDQWDLDAAPVDPDGFGFAGYLLRPPADRAPESEIAALLREQNRLLLEMRNQGNANHTALMAINSSMSRAGMSGSRAGSKRRGGRK